MNHTTKTKTAIVIQRFLLVLLLCISSLQLYADNYVYVCTGKGANKYHYSGECPWMNQNCKGDTKMLYLCHVIDEFQLPCIAALR